MIKTFINNASRKQKKFIITSILLILLEIIFIYLAIVSYNNKNLDKYIFGVNNKINKMFAIMLEDENGDYKTYNSETFPEFPYTFNSDLSQCMDIKGNIIEDAISYDEDTNLVNVVVTKTSQCYFYFYRPKEVGTSLTNELINSGELWQSGLEGDGYRYTGSGSYDSATTPNNFICFGTANTTECKNNETKYMYRIIGVFEGSDGKQHLKLISLKQLEETYMWHSSNSSITWIDSDIYAGLNGSYFLTNATYDYMQNDIWLNKIENWTWSAVDTKISSDGGADYYAITTQEIYLHEMNRSTKSNTVGQWTTPVAKIGLMYASDYQMSLGSSSLSYTSSTNYETLATGWLHQNNNDISKDNFEWTISQSSSATRAWSIRPDGWLGNDDATNANGIRAVFYLKSTENYTEGTGTYQNPYIISSSLGVSAQLNVNEVTGTITQGDYALNKYCINTSSNSYENCTWKKIDSLTITETLPDYGTYYLHVIDKGGYVVHSKAIKYVEKMGNVLIDSGELWQSGLEGDGYRYIGSDNYDSETSPNNFICFGTSDKTECKNNEAKYMYRIIGVFEGADGEQHLKLISFKQLSSTYAWHSSYYSDIDWADSALYTGLNGSYFLTNTTYDYLQNETWLNKIEDWAWSAVNTKTYSESGPNYNTITTQEMYLHEMNRSSKTSTIGEWTTPTAKIGLMYVSDYTLSLGSSALSYTGSSNASTLKTGWMHQSKNDTSTSTTEWTIARYGKYSVITYKAWYVDSSGSLTNYQLNNKAGIRPVFFLISDIKSDSGSGTYSDPYIINE